METAMTMQPARLDLHAIRIDAVAAAYGNADAPMKRLALLNLGARQPAYWTSATFSHAQAGILCEAANRLASLERAQDEVTDYCSATGSPWRPTELRLLDLLVPLNAAAVRDLDEAYTRGGALRSRGELERRAWVGEGEALVA